MHLCVLVNFILYKAGFEKGVKVVDGCLRLLNDSALQESRGDRLSNNFLIDYC